MMYTWICQVKLYNTAVGTKMTPYLCRSIQWAVIFDYWVIIKKRIATEQIGKINRNTQGMVMKRSGYDGRK